MRKSIVVGNWNCLTTRGTLKSDVHPFLQAYDVITMATRCFHILFTYFIRRFKLVMRICRRCCNHLLLNFLTELRSSLVLRRNADSLPFSCWVEVNLSHVFLVVRIKKFGHIICRASASWKFFCWGFGAERGMSNLMHSGQFLLWYCIRRSASSEQRL